MDGMSARIGVGLDFRAANGVTASALGEFSGSGPRQQRHGQSPSKRRSPSPSDTSSLKRDKEKSALSRLRESDQGALSTRSGMREGEGPRRTCLSGPLHHCLTFTPTSAHILHHLKPDGGDDVDSVSTSWIRTARPAPVAVTQQPSREPGLGPALTTECAPCGRMGRPQPSLRSAGFRPKSLRPLLPECPAHSFLEASTPDSGTGHSPPLSLPAALARPPPRRRPIATPPLQEEPPCRHARPPARPSANSTS
jgi:hypothetical protein